MELTRTRHTRSRPGLQDEPEATLREVVAAHIRACARVVAAAAADDRSKRFYRSSGHAWSLALV